MGGRNIAPAYHRQDVAEANGRTGRHSENSFFSYCGCALHYRADYCRGWGPEREFVAGLQKRRGVRSSPQLKFDTSSSSQLLLQYRIHLRWIGLALGGFHHLPNKRVKRFFLASLEFFYRFRVGDEHLSDQFLQCA